MIIGIGQKWYRAQSYYDARHEWMTRYVDSREKRDTESMPAFRGRPPSAVASVFIYPGRAVAVASTLLTVIASLTRLARLQKAQTDGRSKVSAIILEIVFTAGSLILLIALLEMP
jgi:hypothetical protein